MSDSPKTLSRTNFNFSGQTGVYRGKVRDVYTIDKNLLVLVATDRISAFDVVLPAAIPSKGQVLNQLSDYFLSETKAMAENWLLSSPDPNASVGSKAEPFMVEVVVRNCLVGQAWRDYASDKREICGVVMPDGMREYDKFPKPIITPTTKNNDGHDEPISESNIIKTGLTTAGEWQDIKTKAMALFKLGQEMASQKGLYLADTKYEFGKFDGKIIVIDEVHTPDSSRYFYLESYKNYVSRESSEKPKHLSKEFVREWLIEHGFSGQEGEKIPELTDEFVNDVSKRYIELYEIMTGQKFIPAQTDNIVARIEKNVLNTLKDLRNENV